MQHETSFGIFKPVGYLVISLPGSDPATATELAMRQAGMAATDIHRYTDRQMIEQIDKDMANASSIADIGQEMNLVRAHRALAERGYHFLVVRANGAVPAEQLADLARDNGALRAQLYGNFIIEEMIEQPDELPQVAESPDRGLDARTPSGLEVEADTLQRERQGDKPPDPS